MLFALLSLVTVIAIGQFVKLMQKPQSTSTGSQTIDDLDYPVHHVDPVCLTDLMDMNLLDIDFGFFDTTVTNEEIFGNDKPQKLNRLCKDSTISNESSGKWIW